MEFKDLEKRLGKFSISIDFMKNKPKETMEILSKVIIVRAEWMPYGVIEYMAYSPEFEEVSEGQQFHEYGVETTLEDGKAKEVKFKRW